MSSEQRTGWRVIALVVLTVIILFLFRSFGVAAFIIGTLLAFAIVNFGFRGWGLMRTIGNVALIAIAVIAIVTNYLPLTSKSMRHGPERVDTKLAGAMFDPGGHLETLVLDFGMYADSIGRCRMDSAWATLKQRVASDGLTPKNQRLYDSLVDVAQQSKQNIERIVRGQKLAGAQVVKDETPKTQVVGNVVYLDVDLTSAEGTSYKIPSGQSAEISIDSAWYTCKFAELARGESAWCDANGYGIAPKRTRSNAECANRFLNPKESMGAVLIFDEKHPQGYRLAMGQTIVVPSGKVTIAVNDWQGGWLGGEGGSFSASEMIRKGGFFDNRGILRVYIVLKS